MMPETSIRVIARFAAKADHVDQVRGILTALIEPTRRETGCITYELLQNKQDPTDFTFVEEWTSKAALDEHLATEHIENCTAKIGEHIETDPDIRIYEVVD
jgi:quinol monooxygenase YgiN